MKTLILVHGADSFTEEAAYLNFLKNEYIPRYTKPWEDVVKPDWKARIARGWIKDGIVWYPNMPNKQNAHYRDWKLVFEGILAQLNPQDEITLVGGSLGGCFLLKYFSEVKSIVVHQIHLVAACISEGDFTSPTNYEFLQELGDRVHIWHAEDDPVVPFSVGQELAKILPQAQTHFFTPEKGYGHFYGLERFVELESILMKNPR